MNWHLRLIAAHLAACEHGEIKRLVINLPPRYLKSQLINVIWPAWLLGQNPARRIISASYSHSLSLKHAADCRALLTADWFQAAYPAAEIMTGENRKEKIATTQHGFRLASSVGGSLIGEGGDFLILDDPHHPQEVASSEQIQSTCQWIDQVFLPRLNDKKRGVVVMVMQRLHHADATAHVLKKAGWVQLCLPAIAGEAVTYRCGEFEYRRAAGEPLHAMREDAATLKALKAELGSFVFAAQYQQNPVPPEGQVVRVEWLKEYHDVPEGQLVHSWDTAIKAGAANDYSVCSVWLMAEGHYYLKDIWRQKVEFPELKRAVRSLAARDKPDVILIEDKASGQSLLQELRAEHFPLVAIQPVKDKESRLLSAITAMEAGRVMLPHEAGWKEGFLSELLMFPHASHDDMVDSVTQFLNWAALRKMAVMRVRTLS